MKNFKADSHVLGSREGYSTLAMSDGVQPEERLQLESLRYGQTDDESFLQSLASNPSAIGKPLCTGRYAVTRCFIGGRDTAGRSTVKFVSLIFSEQEWVDVVSRNVPALLAETRFWKQAQVDGAVVIGNLPDFKWSGDMKDALMNLLSGFTGLSSKQILGLDDTPIHNLSVQLLPSLLPNSDRAGLSWGVRVLSAGAGLKVGTYPTVADLSSRDRLVSLRQVSREPASYATAIREFWADEALPPRSFIDALPSISSFHHGDVTAEPSTTAVVEAKISRIPKAAYVSFSVLAALVLVSYTVVSLRSNKLGDILNNEAESAGIESELDEIDAEGSRIASTPFQEDPVAVEPIDDSSPVSTPVAGDGLTPNERDATVLVEEFSGAESWEKPKIQDWVSRARALYHVQQVPEFSESLEKAQEVLHWASDAAELSDRLWYRARSHYTGSSLEVLTDTELDQAVHQMRVDASEILSHLNDPRRKGFPAISDSALPLRLAEIDWAITRVDHILKVRALVEAEAEKDAKRAALEAQKANVSPGIEVLERVIEDAKQFARISSHAKGIDDYKKAPSVEVLEEWWSVLDFAAFPDVGNDRKLISLRSNARGWAVRAMRWRFEALKYQHENTEDFKEQEELVSLLKRLAALHGRVEQRDQDEELSQELDDFIKELE